MFHAFARCTAPSVVVGLRSSAAGENSPLAGAARREDPAASKQADMSAAADGRAGPAAGPVQQGLKEALIETLTAILSPVQEVRAAAEEQIKVLEVTEGE